MSLFSASQSNNANTQPGGGLFGSLSNTSQPPATTSLFGAPQPSTTNTQQGGGLFGNTTTQNQGGGLFGSQQNQQPAGSLFNLGGAQQSQPQQGTGLFGSSLNQGQNQQSSNLFGNTLNPQNKGSLFGPTQASSQTQQQRPPVSIFSNSIGQQNQQQQVVPGVRISVNELRPTTRFNDLQEDLQKAIEYVDAFVTNKIKWQEECESSSAALDDMCQQLPPDVEHCSKSLNNVQQSLENDASSIAFAKDFVKADAADAKLSFKVINNLKLPQQFHHANLWSSVSAPEQAGPSFPGNTSEEIGSRNLVDYFSKQADETSKTLASYRRNIAEVEAYLRDIESNALQQTQQMSFMRNRDGQEKSAEDHVRELAGVLREFENGILSVATRVGEARESVQQAMLEPVSINQSGRFLTLGSRSGLS